MMNSGSYHHLLSWSARKRGKKVAGPLLLVVVEVVASKMLQRLPWELGNRPASEHRHTVSDTHLGPQSPDLVEVMVSYETAWVHHAQAVVAREDVRYVLTWFSISLV